MLKLIFTLIFGFIGKTIGGFDDLISTLLAFIMIDYVTGVMKTVINKTLSSEVGYKVILKKY